jgi:hypothetical protein
VRAIVIGYFGNVYVSFLFLFKEGLGRDGEESRWMVGLTVPSRRPNVGPARDTKISAPHCAAFRSPSSSSSWPCMMLTFAFEERSSASFEGVRT